MIVEWSMMDPFEDCLTEWWLSAPEMFLEDPRLEERIRRLVKIQGGPSQASTLIKTLLSSG